MVGCQTHDLFLEGSSPSRAKLSYLRGAVTERLNVIACKAIEETHHWFKSNRRQMFKFKDYSKSLDYNLTKVYGIGSKKGGTICKLIGIRGNTGLNNCNAISQNLQRFNKTNIDRLVKINCYRGRRHRMRLPVRGQRTRSNARTIKRALEKY
jgi:small subunit ribosomal protein S13